VDDLLDVTGSSQELGKDAHHDSEQGKVTWVTLKGEDMAREMAKEHTEKARDAILGAGGDNAFILELTTYMLERKN
jgi:geranylgeranyl diphosphate synthase type II